MEKLNDLVADDDADKEEETNDLGWLLYDAALTSSGFSMDDTELFANRLHRVMKTSLGLDTLELSPEMEVPADVVVEEVATDVEDLDEDDEDEDKKEDDKTDSKDEL